MNDDFLYQLRRSPRQEFADALYGRISQERPPFPFLQTGLSKGRRVALALASSCLVFIAGFGASPTLRAAVGEAIRHLGNIPIWETDQHPFLEGEERVIPCPQPVSLAEAQATGKLPWPAWVPEGFVLQDKVQLCEGDHGKSIGLTWEHAASRRSVSLFAEHLNQDFIPAEIVGSGGVEEVTVNGEPAALVRGAWNPKTKLWGKGLVHLRWSRGQVVYQLITTEGTLSTEELVRMAESVE